MNKAMEKWVIVLLVLAIVAVNAFAVLLWHGIGDLPRRGQVAGEPIDGEGALYQVYQNDRLIESFASFDEARAYAERYANASVKRDDEAHWLWDNTPPYNVYIGVGDTYTAFNSFAEAVGFARAQPNATIHYRKSGTFVWENVTKLKNEARIENVPGIKQYPELFRGCEVTSLAMLLTHKRIITDKMALAEQITKDPTPYEIKNGQIHFGNPNRGFVGDIYLARNRGLGVYHKPIYDLLCRYMPYGAMDLTGCEFEDLYYLLEQNVPVWIITNSSYQKLPPSSFERWETPDGPIDVTYKEHSVLITGYDNAFVYINDPADGGRNIRKNKKQFIEAWEQMGRQAVAYAP